MKKALLAAFALRMLCAAPADPVFWKLENSSGKPVKAGARFSVKLVAAVQPGWHLYSLKPMSEGPISTRIWIGEGQPFSLAGAIQAPEPVAMQDPTLNMEVEFYEGEAAFTLPVKVASGTAAGSQTLTVSASYQACNDKICLPPKNLKVQVPVTIQ
jgi:DsbC/DsbD-like thiol-disulfide interchange protein